MGTITRSTKPTGSTSWANGDTLTDTGLNGDVDNIITQVNGNIENANVSNSAAVAYSKLNLTGTLLNADVNTSAAIAVSKLAQTAGQLDSDIVDDSADNAAAYLTVVAPGTTASPSLPTNLELELHRLRYAIGRLAAGINVKLEANANAAGWIEPPVRPTNHIYNGNFAAWTSSGTAAGDGWVVIGTPATLSTTTVGVSEGVGNELRVQCNDVGEGVGQVVSGLKASTKYLVKARVKALSGDVISLKTDHALGSGSYENLDLDTTTTAAYETLAGIILTDSTPTPIDVNIVGTHASDDFDIADVSMYELDETYTERPGGVFLTDTGTATQDYTAGSAQAIVGLSALSVTAPGPNYAIVANLHVHGDCGSTNVDVEAELNETAVAGGIVSVGGNSTSRTQGSLGIDNHYVVSPAVPGTTYTFTGTVTVVTGNYDDLHSRLTVQLVRLG